MHAKTFVEKLYIKNYKKFEYAEVNFCEDFNILVGPNNSGKSTILEVLDILLGRKSINEDNLEESLFNISQYGLDTKHFTLVAKVRIPKLKVKKGKSQKEYNWVNLLKIAKGSASSQIRTAFITNEISIKDILDQKDIEYKHKLVKDNIAAEPKGLDLSGAELFITYQVSLTNNIPSIEHFLYFKCKGKYSGTDVYGGLIYLNKQIKNNLISFLLIPASRTGTREIFNVQGYTWLGEYLRIVQNKIRKLKLLDTSLASHAQFPIEVNQFSNTILNNLLGRSDYKIELNTSNYKARDKLYQYIHVFLEDPFFDEIYNKGHGMQSAVAISLFAGYIKERCELKSAFSDNKNENQLWSAILALEEPENHFHPPIRQRLTKVLKQYFIDECSQIIMSTHDENFPKWSYINNAHIIFPSSIDKNGKIEHFVIKGGSYSNTMDISERLLRFQAYTLFSEKALILEGCEYLSLNEIQFAINNKDFSDEGIALARSTSVKEYGGGGDVGDAIPKGGLTQIHETVKLYKKLKIKFACLVDIDGIANRGKDLTSLITECGINLEENEFEQIITTEEYKQIESKHKDNKAISIAQFIKKEIDSSKEKQERFNKLRGKMEQNGIFIFESGDFEGLFSDEFIKQNLSQKGEINKESMAVNSKLYAENNNLESILKPESSKQLSEMYDKLLNYFNTTKLEMKTQDHTDLIPFEELF